MLRLVLFPSPHHAQLQQSPQRGLQALHARACSAPRVPGVKTCRAWADPAYKARLLKDGASAATELGIEADGWPPNGGVTGEAHPCCTLTWTSLTPLKALLWQTSVWLAALKAHACNGVDTCALKHTKDNNGCQLLTGSTRTVVPGCSWPRPCGAYMILVCACAAEPNGQLAGVLLKVVEDTPEVFNLLVCTLCSCYPISILGALAGCLYECCM